MLKKSQDAEQKAVSAVDLQLDRIEVGEQGIQGVCCEPRQAAKETCCPSPPAWICGTVDTAVGEVQQISTDWSWPERWGAFRSRISAFRMAYRVEPGLYAVGSPNGASDVFVSANYKLSFDMLRRELKGLSAWILVLDTHGINVWCAAGKGTFGTVELVKRIRDVQLDKVVDQKRIVLPQLGAVGVSAHAVKAETGFRVRFGPVCARDIPAYLKANYTASKEMREIRFGLVDRLILTPMELLPFLKKFPLYAVIVLAVFGLQPQGLLFREAWSGGLPFLLLGLAAILAGALVTPVLLPWIPSRAFSIKGWIVGVLLTGSALQIMQFPNPHTVPLFIFSYLFFPAVSSFIALQFTGSTTYTGKSGVEKELRIALRLYGAMMVLSLCSLIAYKLKEWGVV